MQNICTRLLFLCMMSSLFTAVSAQELGATKKAKLELVKLATLQSKTFFIDTDSKDSVTYDLQYMMAHQPAAFEQSKNALNEVYGYCIYNNGNCAFYGQTYAAELTYTSVQKDTWNGSAWVLTAPKNEWVITSLQRNPDVVKPALVYADVRDPDDEDKSVRLVVLVMGNTSYIVDTVTREDAKFTQYEGLGLCDLRLVDEKSFETLSQDGSGLHKNKINFSDKRYYLVERKYNSDTYADYYQLSIKKYREGKLDAYKRVNFTMKGIELEDKFDNNATLSATLRYINKKLEEANDHLVGTTAKTISVKNSFSLKDNVITYTRKWGQNPGNKKCSESTYETLFTDTYVFPAADIDKVVYGENKEGNLTGFFRISLPDETCKKYESYYSCEKNDNGKYEWNRTDEDKQMLKSLIVYYLLGEEKGFDNLKKALFHLRDLCRKGN